MPSDLRCGTLVFLSLFLSALGRLLQAPSLVRLDQRLLGLPSGGRLVVERLEACRRRLLFDLLLDACLGTPARLTTSLLLVGSPPGSLLAPLRRLVTPRMCAGVCLPPPPLGLAVALLKLLVTFL